MTKIGATGVYPNGKLNEDDEGQLRFAMTVHDGVVILDFGKQIHWLGLPKEEAMKLGQMLIDKANQID